MKHYLKEFTSRISTFSFFLILGATLLSSCDDYIYDDKEPDWLGASIYDYLKEDGNFNYYVQLIEELEYDTILSQTGSKTIFVADDDAFELFFQNNEWGVSSYDELSRAQKSLIINFGMINNAYLVQMLSNYNNNGLKEGQAFRRETAVSVLDSVPLDKGNQLPETPYWNFYRDKGIYILKDNTVPTLMYFTQKHMEQSQISDDDFAVLTGLSREFNDAHIFGIKIKQKDITCKNGYINVLDRLMIPPKNMAEYINTNTNTSLFAKVMNRFCVPRPDQANTVLYQDLMNRLYGQVFTDTIFVKRYFSNNGGTQLYPNGQSIPTDLLLPFDPGWNMYARTTGGNALQSDMAAMFVPTNAAMQNYFDSPQGAVLKDRFQYWDSVPLDILPLFIKRHMRTSLIESVPSRFANMVDTDNSLLPVERGDIEKVYLGTNGAVFETNKVYPPDDYISVYGPVLLSANDASEINKTKIWKWAIVQNDFRLYLNSLVSRYSFFVPTDEYFKNYIDPISNGKEVVGALRFWYNSLTNAVNASIHRFDPITQTAGDSVGNITNQSFLVNRLLDMLNSHVVVGGVESGRNYFVTKGNVVLKVTGAGENMKIQAGGNMQLNESVNVNRAYQQSNGNTYFIDRPIQSPARSVYKVLSETPDFSEFFNLLLGFPSTSKSVVFVQKSNYFGIDYNVKFFNTFNYTVYVPTNAAIQQALADGLIRPWETQGAIEGINDMTDPVAQEAEIVKLERFIRYHFQDNSVFVDNYSQNRLYQSATIKLNGGDSYFGTFRNKYYKIGVSGTSGNLTLRAENGATANVVTAGGLYNILTRDFVFNNRPSAFKNVDGTGAGSEYNTSNIVTSSTAVVHQIDKVLNFQ